MKQYPFQWIVISGCKYAKRKIYSCVYTHTHTLHIYMYTIQEKQKHFTFIIKHFTKL